MKLTKVIKLILTLTLLIFNNLLADTEYKWTLGTSVATFNTNMQFNPQSLDESKFVDLEDDLGFDESINFFSASLETKFNQNHSLYINVSPFIRKANKFITKDIEFEDDTLLVDSEIYSRFSNTTFDLKYGYKIKTTEKAEFEAIVGIYWMNTRYKLNASGLIENELGEINFDSDYQKKRSVGVPLPLIGIGYQYYLNKNWTILGSARYFQASILDFHGSVGSAILAAEYVPTKNWGYGVSLSYLNVDVEVDKTNFNGELNWQYLGLNAYLYYQY